MRLRNIYLLRISVLEVYLNIIQIFLKNTVNYDEINALLHLQQQYFTERKQIRKLLNILELEKLCQR